MDEPAGFNVCLFSQMSSIWTTLMQNVCYHTGLFIILKEERVAKQVKRLRNRLKQIVKSLEGFPHANHPVN